MDDTQKTLPPSSPTPNPSKDPQSTLDDILSQLEEQYKKAMDRGTVQEKVIEEKKEHVSVPVITPPPPSSSTVLEKPADAILSAPKTETIKTELSGANLSVAHSPISHAEEHTLPHSSAIDAAQKKVTVEPIGSVVKPTTIIEPNVMKTMQEDGIPPKKVEPLPASAQSTTQEPTSPFARVVKKMGKTRTLVGSLLIVLTIGGLIGASYLVKKSQDTRKHAAGFCEVKTESGETAGFVICDTPGETLTGTWDDVNKNRNVDNAAVTDSQINYSNSTVTSDQPLVTVQTDNNNNIVDNGGGGGNNNNGGNNDGGNNGGGNTTPPTTAGGVAIGGADTKCTAAEQKDCGGANQGYCVCGSSQEKLCKGNYTPMGGDCVPAGTKEAVAGKPGDTGTQCQSNSGCADGLECSSHVCQEKPKTQPTSVADTGVGRGAQGACWCQEKGLVCTNNGKAQWMGPVGECTDAKNDGKSAGKILDFSSSNAVNERVGINEAKYGTGSLEIITPGGGPSGYQVKDLVAGQTIGNMCDNADYAKAKPCNTHADWERGYYDAKKPENFGKKATQPEYTDAVGHDLDGNSANGYQIGKIEWDPVTKQFVIKTAFTLNTSAMKIDPSSVFTVSQNADGTASLTRISSSASGGSSGTLPPDWFDRAKNGKCNSPAVVPNDNPNVLNTYDLVDPTFSKHDLLCEPVNGMAAFCVPNGWLGSKGCDQYVLEGGGALRYGGNAVFVAQACSGVQDEHGIITCSKDSKYWQCSPYEYSTLGSGNVVSVTEVGFKCYEKDPAKRLSAPAAAPFTVNGDCISSKNGGTIAGYYCQGSAEAGRSLGCNDPSPLNVSPRTSGQICVNDIVAASDICGVVQVDGDGIGTDGQYYHYSINVASTNGCGSGPRIPTPPIVQVSCLPGQCGGTTSICTENCGGTTPSPPPPGSPVCVDITTSIAAPTIGQAPVFTCSPAAEATRYEFRYKIGSGAYSAITPASTNSNVSTPLTVNASGVYTVQCRPCNANGCANWDNL
ncbi:MAG: hypothetical protein HZA34_02615 [Candidatus Pacebacteria bacterium]|nr:hypothetical protein [Candidatus Paceibacterota bacterium]